MTVKKNSKKAPQMKLNGEKTAFNQGETILEVARRGGIHIPTLCHLDSEKPFASCMVCVIEEAGSGKLLPACSTPARSGMNIRADTPAVKEQRRRAVELLLSEHLGDCEGLCELSCPAYLNVPEMIRLAASDELETASDLLRDALAFPKIISRICDAPCEKGCRRARIDESVSIKLIERFIADNATREIRGIPKEQKAAKSSQSIAVIGGGAAGLACAFHLNRLGFACEIFEKERECWGGLANIADTILSKKLLDEELETLKKTGVEIHTNYEVEPTAQAIRGLLGEFSAVVVATGALPPGGASEGETYFGLKTTGKGFWSDSAGFAASMKNVFVLGDAVLPLRKTVQSLADAKLLSERLAESLLGRKRGESSDEFNSRFGKLFHGDLEEFAKAADTRPRAKPVEQSKGFSKSEAVAEAERCLRCDCVAADDCRLRELADEFGATGKRAASRRGDERRKFIRVFDCDIVFEPGKCVKCGKCVKISAQYGERSGPVFVKRGYETEIAFPFGISPKKGLGEADDACAEACPTGAIAKTTRVASSRFRSQEIGE